MKNVEIQFKSHFNPITYTNVEEFYDCFGWIEIVEHRQYTDIKTRIRKDALNYYKVIDSRV